MRCDVCGDKGVYPTYVTDDRRGYLIRAYVTCDCGFPRDHNWAITMLSVRRQTNRGFDRSVRKAATALMSARVMAMLGEKPRVVPIRELFNPEREGMSNV